MTKHRGDLPKAYRENVFHQSSAKEIGKRLQEVRSQRGYTMTYVARQLRITKQMIYDYENGIRAPRFDLAGELALFYETSLDWIATGRQTPLTPRTSSD